MSAALTDLSLDLSLLPSNATAFERDLAALSTSIDEIDPTVIETIWDAWSCPSALLPWLAQALSVDLWDDDWNEVAKRQAIADSPAWHRIKGTRRAVEIAVELVAQRALVTEWFERIPNGRRGTAEVIAEPRSGADLVALAASARRLVAASKPKSRSVSGSVGLIMDGAALIAVGLCSHAVMTIEPIPRILPQLTTEIVVQIGHYSTAHMRLEPRTA